MFIISKKENIFFNQFIKASQKALEAANVLNELVLDYNNNDFSLVDKISIIETECDQIVHETLYNLNRSFITPIDREDIDEIIKELDTITDTIDDTAQYLKMFNVVKLKSEIIEFSSLTIEILKELECLLKLLSSMKKNTSEITKKVIRINDIENKGDNLYLKVISQLFKEEKNSIEIIKWKDIFSCLEDTLDQCEKVANIVEGMVIKHV